MKYMNDREKVKKYSHISEISDRFFIDKIPNEEDLTKFEEWKKITINEIFKSCMSKWNIAFLTLLMISISMIISIKYIDNVTAKLLISDSTNKSTRQIMIMLILFAIVLVLILVFLIRGYINSKSWKMDYCKYGKVVDKYIWNEINIGGRNRKFYYAIVLIDEQLFKIRIRSIKNYNSLEINEDPRVFIKDNAIVFFIKGKKELNVMKK